jgi:nicotinamidase/pyrazinamidase
MKKLVKKAKAKTKKVKPRTKKRTATPPQKISKGTPMLNVQLICIDDQNDFTDPNGSLFVKGGDENVKRVARMIERIYPKLSEIRLTMDSHHKFDISHPMFWVDADGNRPKPLVTVITSKDVEEGRWRPYIIGHRTRALKYLKELERKGRYPHVIWPEHCLIGDSGHNINPVLAAAVHLWEDKRFAMSDVVTKGSNPWTEHFSAIQAEVPDPEDITTQVNRTLVEALEKADMVIWVGEALSHCLANTFRDAVANFGNKEHVKKMVLCTDASSSVPGFEKYGDDFVREMTALGMRLDTTTSILA